ncbi:hypothetical protein HAX54_048973, partial [Datura stramonium]|nr:hypothetical protein [Datura stramonium]
KHVFSEQQRESARTTNSDGSHANYDSEIGAALIVLIGAMITQPNQQTLHQRILL